MRDAQASQRLSGGKAAPPTAFCAPDEITIEIEVLAAKLAKERSKLIAKIPKNHNGPNYIKSVKRFLKEVKEFRKSELPEIYKLGKRITAAYGPDWLNNPGAVSTWHQLSVAAAYLSDHPHEKKPVSALFVSIITGELIEVEVNRIPDGIKRRPEYMLERLRRGIMVCAERNGIRNLITKLSGINISLDERSINAERNKKYKQLSEKFRQDFPGKNNKRARRDALAEAWMFAQIALTQDRVANFNSALISAANRNATLNDLAVITPPPTCVDCAPVIAPHKPSALVHDSRLGGIFTRNPENPEAEALLKNAGIRIVDLSSPLATLNLC